MSKNKKSNQKEISFWKEVKKNLSFKRDNKEFPWLQSGLILLGFTLGVFVTSGVDIISRIDLSKEEEVIAEEMDDSEKCREQGGRYDRFAENCLLVTEDRGEPCTDKDDCSGYCLVDDDATLGEEVTGYCSENFIMEGCFKFADRGKVNSICIPD